MFYTFSLFFVLGNLNSELTMAQAYSSYEEALLTAVKVGTFAKVKTALQSGDLKRDGKHFDYTLLTEALKRGDKKIANFLLEKKCRVKRDGGKDPDCTPLYYAVKLGDIGIIKTILDRGASCKDSYYNENSPLFLAIKKKKFYIADLILSAYNFGREGSEDDMAHFHIACITDNLKMMENFLKHQVSVYGLSTWDIEKWRGFTALHFVVEYDTLLSIAPSVNFLLDHGADLYAQDTKGSTPFHLAFYKYNKFSNAVFPSEAANKCINSVDKNGLSIFHICCTKKNLNIIEAFLKNGVDMHAATLDSDKYPGATPLHYAVHYECIEVIKLLLEHGADFNVGDSTNRTALHCAFYNGYGGIISFLLERIPKDINLTDSRGLTYFHIACVNGNSNQIETFLGTGVSPDIHVDLNDDYHDSGFTALHFSIDSRREDIVELLLKYGANVNAEAGSCTTPLHLACRNIVLDRYFFTRETGGSMVELLLAKGANVNCQDKDGVTPLHMALEHRKTKLVQILFKYHADSNVKTRELTTPLHIAVEKNRCRYMDTSRNIIKTLLRNYSDVNARNAVGETPLHIAFAKNDDFSVEWLLMYGADINSEDYSGQSPMMKSPTSSSLSIQTLRATEMHLCRLSALKFHISEMVIKICLEKKLNLFNDGNMVQCTNELERLTQMRINDYCTMYDILLKDHVGMVKYVRNHALGNILWQRNFQLDFPLYHNMLKLQYGRGSVTSVILERAKMSLDFMVGLNLPDSCSESILGYLANENIENLMEATKTDSRKRKLDVRSSAESDVSLVKKCRFS